jgi:predicted RNA-binding protein associated with RNAse of E/G family
MTSCLEKKLTLAGATKTYRCELISLRHGVGILRYIIEQAYDVAGFLLAPGDETLAVYWQDRPYTLYIWRRRRQGDRAYYFNIADSVELGQEEFRWRDLAVDILVDQNGAVKVLDEHELPPDLPPSLLDHIMVAKKTVLAGYEAIIEEAEKLIGSDA